MGKNNDKHEVLKKLNLFQFYIESIPTLKITTMTEATGSCPFHDDQHPSFTVNLETWLWNCHAGCGGGDVFDFVMRRDQVGFSEALEILTRRATVTMESKGESQFCLEWVSPKSKVEYGGWIKFFDGCSWVLVQEFIGGDLVWVHRFLITDSEDIFSQGPLSS